MYYIVFCIAAILLLSALIGLKRGLFKTLFGFLALVLSIGTTYIASPYVSAFIMENTDIDERIEDIIYEKIEKDTKKSVEESLKDAGIKKDLDKLSEEETKSLMENDPDKATQVQRIDSLNLPSHMKDLYIENNNDNIYSMLGVTGFYRYIAKYTSRLAVNAIGLIATFIALRLVLFLISLIIRKSMEADPVLSGADRFAGMILGLVAGIVVVWAFMIIAGLAFGSEFDSMIESSKIITFINNYNLLLKAITNITA